jgi:hypothetical protein
MHVDPCKISIYSDGTAQYAGRHYADVGQLLLLLDAEHGDSVPPVTLAIETPGDYEAVGRIIYGMQRGGSGARLQLCADLAVDPRDVITTPPADQRDSM